MKYISTGLRAIATAMVAVTSMAQIAQADYLSRDYAAVRGWEVSSLEVSGAYSGCGMLRREDAGDFRLRRDRGEWTFLVEVSANAIDGEMVRFFLDVGKFSEDLTGEVLEGMVEAPISASFVDLIASGASMTAELNGSRREFSLSGTTAAILKVQECDDNRGRIPKAAAVKTKPEPQVVESEHLRMGQNCPALGSVRSPDVQDWGDITFVNRSGRAVTVYWLDWNGQPVEMAPLSNGDQSFFNSQAGHFFIAKDFDMTCHGGVIEVPLGESIYEIR